MLRNLKLVGVYAVVVVAALATAVIAQGPRGENGQKQNQGQNQGQRQGKMGGPPPMMMLPKLITAVEAPMPLLINELTLTEEQVNQIEQIRKDYMTTVRDLRPKPATPGERPDQATMEAVKAKALEAEIAANKAIHAVLTDDQNTKLIVLLKKLNVAKVVGLPYEVIPQLNLTDDQKTKIGVIADKAIADTKTLLDTKPKPKVMMDALETIKRTAHESTLALLTDEQKATLETFANEHPRPRNGRPGGPGEGPGGPDGKGRPGGPGGPEGPGGPDGSECPPPPAE